MNTKFKNLFMKFCPYILYMYLKGIKFPFDLEIHLSEHCNLNCISCMHYSSIADPAFPDLNKLTSQIKILSKSKKYFKTVRLLGGEPLLNPNIVEIINMIRYYLGDIEIELVTNGILLLSNRIDLCFWNACRENNIIISITKYPINLDYNKIRELCKNNNCKVRIFGDRMGKEAFCAYKLNSNRYKKNFIKYITCQNRRCLQLVGENIYPCSISAYVEHVNKKFNTKFIHSKKDCLSIENLNLFKLIRFTSRVKPFCSYCSPRSKGFPWSRSNFLKDEWVINR